MPTTTEVTVYTGPNCAACRFTKRWLQANGIPFEEIDVEVDQEAGAYLRRLGHTELPVVVTDYTTWSGFRATELTALRATLAGEHNQEKEIH